ncbi:TolC family protein [Solimonas marina]|uniref:TolC family protein n=1 Tax=Solimonas marina TaxID=2714601 RepID=A0A970BAT3_9GAMM|nr:TolC family protein [Solimonas marina]NKF23706.1 TolC family protein [Solimonas marina]
MLSSCCRPAAGLALLLGLAMAATAASPAPEAPHPSGPLTLADATALAIKANPKLARFVYDRAAAGGQRLQAGLGPRPELGIELENFGGTGPYRGADSIEATLRLTIAWQRIAKRQARIGVTDARLAQLDHTEIMARLDVVAETTRRFLDVIESQAQLALAARGVGYAEQTLAAAKRRVAIGAASSLEVNRARIALERVQLEHEHYEHLLATQRRRLGAQWGETVPQFERADGELGQLPDAPDYTALLERLRRSPDYARYDVEQRLREAQLRLARQESNDDPRFSAGVRRLQGSGDYALVASLLLPLSISNRNQGAIVEAEALRDRVAVDRQAAAVESETVLYDFVQALRHARTMAESLRSVLLPQADEALMLTRRGYANGRYSQIDLLDAQQTRLDLEQEWLTNVADYHRTLAAVDRMTALAPDTNASLQP